MAGVDLARQVGLVALGKGAGALSNLAVSAVLAWAWSEDQAQLGAYAAVWTLGNTLIPLFMLGIPSSLLYFYPQLNRSGQQRLLLQAALCLAASGLVLGGLLLAVGPRLGFLAGSGSGVGAGDPFLHLAAFVPYTCFWVAGGLVEPGLVAAGRPVWQAWISLGVAVGQLALGLAAVLLDWGVGGVFWGFSGLGVARFLVGMLLVGAAAGGWGGRWSASGLGELLRYSLPVALGDGVGSAARAVDRMVILVFFSAETLALYHLGAIEIPVSILLASATTVLIPQVSGFYAQGQRAKIAALWRTAAERLSLVVLPVFFLFFALAGSLIEVVYPQQYGQSAWVMRVLLLAMPLRCAIYNPLLVGMGKARWALWVGVGDLLLNAALSVALTQLLLSAWPAWAFLGPAVATVLSTWVQVGVLVALISWHLDSGLGELLPWRHLGRVSLICGCAAALSWAVKLVDTPPPVGLGLAVAVFAAVVLMASRPADRAVFVNLLRARKRL